MTEIFTKQLKQDLKRAVKQVNKGVPLAIHTAIVKQQGIQQLDEIESIVAIDKDTGYMLIPTKALETGEYTEETQVSDILYNLQIDVTDNMQKLLGGIF